MSVLSDHYDWVVLGDHPGALLSGTLAAKLGLSVLILPLAPGARAMISNSRQCLDPEPNYVLGMGRIGRSHGLLRECLNHLGLTSSESEFIQQKHFSPQVMTPSSRVCFTFEDDPFLRELQREFGEETAEKLALVRALRRSEHLTLSYWYGLPARLSLAKNKTQNPEAPITTQQLRRRLNRVAKRASAEERAWFMADESVEGLAERLARPDLAETCKGLWFGVASVEAEKLALVDLIQMLALGRTGASFQGGMTAYREFLLRMAKRLGAQVPAKMECRRLFVENGRFVGVQIAHRGNMISVGGGVLGCSLDHVRDRVTQSGKSWMRKLKSAPVPRGWRFTLGLTVHAEALPPGMTSQAVWQEPGAPVLSIEVADPSDYGLIEPENRLIFVRTVLPFTRESLNVEYQRMISARMLRQVTEIFPFLEYHLKRVYPDFRAAATEPLSEAYGFASPEMIPENLRSISAGGVGSRSGVEGLFVASGESFPELGSMGGTVAGIEATAWIAHRSGLPGPMN